MFSRLVMAKSKCPEDSKTLSEALCHLGSELLEVVFGWTTQQAFLAWKGRCIRCCCSHCSQRFASPLGKCVCCHVQGHQVAGAKSAFSVGGSPQRWGAEGRRLHSTCLSLARFCWREAEELRHIPHVKSGVLHAVMGLERWINVY